MSGVGNTTSGATIFSENTTSGGPNDVVVANLRVQQDMRVDGNFEVGTFSIDDLTVNDDLNVTDELTVGGNTYAQYLETALDINCKGDLLVEETIVCDGVANLNGGADMPPTKRLRVGDATVHCEVNQTELIAEDANGESRLNHNRLHISDTANTHVARVRLNGSTMEVGPNTASTLALQTGGTTRATVNATTGQVAITNGISSSSPTTGALVITGGLGVSGAIYASGRIQTAGDLQTTSTTSSTTIFTGAIIAAGGLGIDGAINAGGYIKTTSTTASTSKTTGAIIIPGGAGIGGAVYCDSLVSTNEIKGAWYTVMADTTLPAGTSGNSYSFPVPAGAKLIRVKIYLLSTTSTTMPFLRCGNLNPVDSTGYESVGPAGVGLFTDRIGIVHLSTLPGTAWAAANEWSGTIELVPIRDSSNVLQYVVAANGLCKTGATAGLTAQAAARFTPSNGLEIQYFQISSGAGNFDSGRWGIEAMF
jgi:cytoskeletal protein CcmA (bactofilin family)